MSTSDVLYVRQTERSLSRLMLDIQTKLGDFPGAGVHTWKMERAWNFLNPHADYDNFEFCLEVICRQMDRNIVSFRRTFMRFFVLH